jgi:hypothetical protein
MFSKAELTGQAIMSANASKRRSGKAGIILLAWFAIGISGRNALAAQITLVWDPNPETDLAGYRIHYGTDSRSYSVHIDVGNVTSYTVSNLAEGFVYYFSATAYDSLGNESGYSEEAVSAPDPCDLDLDGDVDGYDLALFIVAYEGGLIEADLDLDMRVDSSDVEIFAQRYDAGG